MSLLPRNCVYWLPRGGTSQPWLSALLFLEGIPCLHWNWRRGIRMDKVSSGLPLIAGRLRVKWYLPSSCRLLGGFFAKETTNSLDFNPALKVVSCTLSFASSTSKISRVKRVTYDLRVSFSLCLMVSKWSAGLFGHCLLMKWQRKELPSCLKLSMNDVGSLVNHSLVAPLRVVGKEGHSISLGGYWRPKIILKVLRWSKISFNPSNGLS